MIKIKVYFDKIVISGHANYSEYGKDIVCASVSSVIYTTVNSIMDISENAITFVDNNKEMIITKNKSNDIVDSLLNTMIKILRDLERQYKKNIKIESEE